MKYLFLILAVSIPLCVQAAWVDSNGEVRPDTESMRSDGNFGVQMILTPDDKEFRETWVTTKSTPKVNTINTVNLGSSIAAVLIFHGCTPNVSGACDLVSKFFLVSPDGTVIPAGGGPVWTDKPMPHRVLQLGRASMVIGFDDPDPLGQYKIIAQVKDRVSGRQLKLISKFNLKE